MQIHFGKSSLAVLGAAVLLTACGGGGGGGSSGPAYGGPTAPVAITADNADALATEATGYATTDPSMFDTGVADFMGISISAAAFPKGLDSYLRDAYTTEKTRQASMGLRATEAWTEECDTGSASVSVKYSNSDTIQSGDVVSISFKDCEMYTTYPNSVVLSGSARLAFTSVTGDMIYSDNFQASITSSADNLKIAVKQGGTLTGDYALMHGSYTMSIDSATPTVTMRLTSSAMLMQAVESGTLAEMLLEGLDQSYSLNSSTGQATYSNDFTLYSTDIGGKLVIDTTSAFTVDSWGTAPSSGIMVITGANGGKLRITAMGSTGYEMALDVDPVDGDYETTEIKAW